MYVASYSLLLQRTGVFSFMATYGRIWSQVGQTSEIIHVLRVYCHYRQIIDQRGEAKKKRNQQWLYFTSFWFLSRNTIPTREVNSNALY